MARSALPAQKKKELLLLLAPAVIVLLVMVVFPLVFALHVSLTDYDISKIRTQGAPFVGLRNFSFVLHDSQFWNSLRVTSLFTLLAIAFELPIGLGLAYMFDKPRPSWLSATKILLFLPMAIAPVVVGLLFRWFYSDTVGIFNYFITSLGLAAPSWGSTGSWALFSIVLADVWEWTPFVFLISLAGLQGISHEQYQAASIDGANAWQTFWRITFPQLRPTIILVFLLRVIPAIKEFDKPFILTGGGPGIATETVSLYIYKQLYWFNHMGRAVAVAIMLIILTTILCQLAFALLRRSEEW